MGSATDFRWRMGCRTGTTRTKRHSKLTNPHSITGQTTGLNLQALKWPPLPRRLSGPRTKGRWRVPQCILSPPLP